MDNHSYINRAIYILLLDIKINPNNKITTLPKAIVYQIYRIFMYILPNFEYPKAIASTFDLQPGKDC